MFDIHYNGPDICLVGRLDAAQAGKAREFFVEISVSQEVDFDKLDYISSAGLGVLLSTQKRLGESGHSLRLKNLKSDEPRGGPWRPVATPYLWICWP